METEKIIDQKHKATAISTRSRQQPVPDEDDSISVYLYLLLFSSMMFTLPFGAFYVVKDLLHNKFHIDGFENNCWSVLAAVIVVNLILCIYAYVAFQEDKKDNSNVENNVNKKKN